MAGSTLISNPFLVRKFPKIVPRPLWLKIQRILPKIGERSAAGGRKRISDREILAAYGFLRVYSARWQDVPRSKMTKISAATLNRRFKEWERAGVFEKLKHPKYSHFDRRIGRDWYDVFNFGNPPFTRNRLAPTEVRKKYRERDAANENRRTRLPRKERGPQVPNRVWSHIKAAIPQRAEPSKNRLDDRNTFDAIFTKLFFDCSWEDLKIFGYGNIEEVRQQFDDWRCLGVFEKIAELKPCYFDKFMGFDWAWLWAGLPYAAAKERPAHF